MHVISVNLGRIREVTGPGGDQQANATNHGGVLKPLLAYPFEHYAEFWQLALATTPLAYGSFGENPTTQGWMDDQIHVGDTIASSQPSWLLDRG
jgi:MOSC domain-containing protein YiiM